MSDEPFPGSAADFYERIQEYKGIGERLRESDERLSAALEEIERLKTINSSRTFLYLEARSLITELCDALEQVSWRAEDRAQLIKSAREVIR